MQRGRWWLAAFAILGSACAPSPSIRAGREQVVIGVVGAFSGTGALETTGIARGARIAVDEYNRDPESIFEARIEQADTAGTAEGAASTAGKIVTADLLVGIVGPFTIEEASAAATVFDQAEVPFLVPSVSDVSFSQVGFRQLRRLVADDRQEGAAMAVETLRRVGRSAKLAIIHDGSGGGVAFADGAREKAESAGGPTAPVFEAAGAVDWNALAAQIMKDPPAALIHGGAADRAAAFVAASRSAGFEGLFIASRHARDATYRAAAGEAAEGTLSDTTCADPADPSLSRFRDAHSRRFEALPQLCSHEAYEGTWMLLEAVQEVEPNPRKVSEFFRNARSFLGDAKLYEYGEDGQLVNGTVWVSELKGGNWRFRRLAQSGP